MAGSDPAPSIPSPHARRRRGIPIAGAAVLAAGALVFLAREPSHDRVWLPDQQVLPTAEFRGDSVRVRHIRNAVYRSPSDYDLAYVEGDYDLNAVRTVDLVVEELDWRHVAHTLLSFGFEDGRHLAISVEARKEIGESYHPLRGLLRSYELIYVIGDERDLIGLRTNHRNHAVWLYPVRTSPRNARRLLEEMLREANRLREHPRFYNTLTSTCTTNLARHANRLEPGSVPWSWRLLLPAHAPEYAHRLGLLEGGDFDSLRAGARIDSVARSYGEGPEFSRVIRPGRVRGPEARESGVSGN